MPGGRSSAPALVKGRGRPSPGLGAASRTGGSSAAMGITGPEHVDDGSGAAWTPAAGSPQLPASSAGAAVDDLRSVTRALDALPLDAILAYAGARTAASEPAPASGAGQLAACAPPTASSSAIAASAAARTPTTGAAPSDAIAASAAA